MMLMEGHIYRAPSGGPVPVSANGGTGIVYSSAPCSVDTPRNSAEQRELRSRPRKSCSPRPHRVLLILRNRCGFCCGYCMFPIGLAPCVSNGVWRDSGAAVADSRRAVARSLHDLHSTADHAPCCVFRPDFTAADNSNLHNYHHLHTVQSIWSAATRANPALTRTQVAVISRIETFFRRDVWRETAASVKP